MKKTLRVEGMSCGHCKNAVETAVKSLPGVAFAEVDLAAKTLTVEFDDTKADIEQVRAAIEDVGFEVV